MTVVRDALEDLLVRPARSPDVLSVGLIERKAFADPWGSREFSTALDSPHTVFLVADAGSGVVIGYVIALAVADESEVLNLAVDEVHRGRGIGGMLLDRAIDEVRSRGASQAWLEVRESNSSARSLYVSRGFREISRRHRYYRMPVEDALLLTLAL